MNEWYCPECDMKNSGSVKTCSSCGAAKSDDAVEATTIKFIEKSKWRCNACNYENSPKVNKCRECGASKYYHDYKEKKPINPMLIVVPLAVIFFAVIPFIKGVYGSSDIPSTNSKPKIQETERADDSLPSAAKSSGIKSINHGEMLEFNEYDGGVVIKVKIKQSYSNKTTISQNYFNIDDLIVNQGCSKYDEIQYWAVAQMTDGTDSKVISFTVPKSTITKIKNGDIAANQMGDFVDDLYILPSLLEE